MVRFRQGLLHEIYASRLFTEAPTSCENASLDDDDPDDVHDRTPVDIICMLSPDRP